MRLTLDLDEINWKVSFAYQSMKVLSKIFGRGEEPRIRLSSSGRGVHLKVHGLKLGFWTIILLRRLLGDDRMRIRFDIRRHKKPKQILFTVKNGFRSGVWVR